MYNLCDIKITYSFPIIVSVSDSDRSYLVKNFEKTPSKKPYTILCRANPIYTD